MTIEVIDSFSGPYTWLSNFAMIPFVADSVTWPSVEHAYQAGKTLRFDLQHAIRLAKTPRDAKRLGRKVALRDDWEDVKDGYMAALLRTKFAAPLLGAKLVATGRALLIEGNSWHDNYWGDCVCPKCCTKAGLNKLGGLLMVVREELRSADWVAAEALGVDT